MTLELTKDDAEVLSEALGIVANIYGKKRIELFKTRDDKGYVKANHCKVTCWLLKQKVEGLLQEMKR